MYRLKFNNEKYNYRGRDYNCRERHEVYFHDVVIYGKECLKNQNYLIDSTSIGNKNFLQIFKENNKIAIFSDYIDSSTSEHKIDTDIGEIRFVIPFTIVNNTRIFAELYTNLM